jgi:uncharacterized membrane protein
MDKNAFAGTYAEVIHTVSGMIAPVFMVLAGISIVLAINFKRGNDNFDLSHERLLKKIYIIRGFEIWAVGFGLEFFFWAMNSFHSPWTRIFNVNILHCIGVSMALVPLLAWPEKGFNLPALLWAVVFVLGAQISWRMALPSGKWQLLWGYVAQIPHFSRFPLLPYGAWTFAGVFTGGLYLKARESAAAEKKFWLRLLIAAILFLAASHGTAFVIYKYNLQMIGVALGEAPPVTTVDAFLYKLSIVLFLLFFAKHTENLFLKVKTEQKPLLLFGRTSLFAYCVHLILIYYPFNNLFYKNLGKSGHALAVTGLAVLMYGLCYLWSRRKLFIQKLQRPL